MLELRPLSDVLAKKAREELNENPKELEFYLSALRDWVKYQTQFKSRTSDQFLIVFLRSSKYSLEKAKHKLKNFYIYRALMPEIFKNRNVDNPKVNMILKSGCVLHLPEPIAEDGSRVIMLRLGFFNLDQHTIPDVFQVGSMATDLLLYEDDNAMVAGYEIIMDFGNMPAAVILQFDPNFVKKLTILANKISPTRMKGFHFLNVPTIFEKLFNMIKSVINVKLRDRFYVHGSNYESLYDRIPRRILPQEYGGECNIESMQNAWCEKLKKNKDFFADEESYGVFPDYVKSCRNEANGFGEENNTTFDTTFGVSGSFRKLNLD